MFAALTAWPISSGTRGEGEGEQWQWLAFITADRGNW